MSTPATSQSVIRRRNGVFLVFAISGLAFSSWVARLPGIRDILDINAAEVGMFLFGSAAGAIGGLALSSHIMAYLGTRKTILVFALLAIGAVGLVGLVSEQFHSLALSITVMVIFGMGLSVTDVAMNVEGAAVEQDMNRTIMPWFHALFSLGTAVGGSLAAAASALGISVPVHLGVMAVVLLGPTLWSVALLRHTQNTPVESEPEPRSTLAERLNVWTEARTVLIGVVGLSMAFAEGSANDWLALGMVDDRGYSNSAGALWFVLFVSAMTAGRIFGVPLIDRFGRVAMLQLSALAAFVGVAAIILVENPVVSAVAVVLWGLGSALGFPVAMSAAADDPKRGPARVSAVATVAYAAFLVGPPLIGGLAETFGILNALWVVAGLVAIGFLAIPATKKPEQEQARS